MRIAHVTATFPPHYTGTGMVCYHNALGLARLGHEVSVVTAEYPRDGYADPEEISVHRLPALFQLGNAPCLTGLTMLRDFDIIHLHYPFIFGAEGVWMASRMWGIPCVVTHHNDLLARGTRRLLFGAYTAISRVLLRAVRRYIVVSLDHAASSRLGSLFRERWRDVVEVPNGVDANRFRPGLDGAPVRRKLGIPRKAQVVLFVGVLDRAHHYRRVDLLLEAVGKLQRAELHLVVVGDGNRAAAYQNQATEMGLAAKVHFLGRMPQWDLPRVYSAADLVVLPSQLQESFGLVLIEGMACGKPVLASDLPGVRSIVTDGEDGLLVPPGDGDRLAAAMCELLECPERRREMGRQGRAKVERAYAWSKIIPRLVRIYSEVLAEAWQPGMGGPGGGVA